MTIDMSQVEVPLPKLTPHLATVVYLGMQGSESAKLAWWSRRGGGERPLLGQCSRGGTEVQAVFLALIYNPCLLIVTLSQTLTLNMSGLFHSCGHRKRCDQGVNSENLSVADK